MLDKYIQALIKDLEIEGTLASPIPGVFNFPLEENLNVTIADKAPGFSLACNVAPIPKTKEEEFYTRCLLGNLFFQGTKGSVLGISEDGNILTLTQTIEHNADYKEFKDVLEDFINSVDYWREETGRYAA